MLERLLAVGGAVLAPLFVLDDEAADLEVGEDLQSIDAGGGRPAGGVHQRADLFDQRAEALGDDSGSARRGGWSAG